MILGRDSRFKNAYYWWISIFLIIVLVSFKYPVGQQLNLTFAPVFNAVQAPVRWYQSFLLWFESAEKLQAEYQNLQILSKQQQAILLERDVLRTENKQLRELLNITQIEGYTWRVASVTSRGTESKSRRLMIEVPNVHMDDVVASDEGLVGLVDMADSTHATVRTILDASVTVPVTMLESDLAGLVRGAGEHLIVDFVPLVRAPHVGEILVTSGAGGIFPAGLPVARVDNVKAIAGGVFAEVTASPVAAWQRDAWLAVANRVLTEAEATP